MTLRSILNAKTMLAAMLMLSASAFAQVQEPEAAASAATNVIMLNCVIENPEDLAKSDVLGNYSVRPRSAVKLAMSPAEGVIGVSLQLSAGRYSLTPRDPRLYQAKIKSPKQLQSGEFILRNVDREETDQVSLAFGSDDNIHGIISTYGANLKITCSNEDY